MSSIHAEEVSIPNKSLQELQRFIPFCVFLVFHFISFLFWHLTLWGYSVRMTPIMTFLSVPSVYFILHYMFINVWKVSREACSLRNNLSLKRTFQLIKTSWTVTNSQEEKSQFEAQPTVGHEAAVQSKAEDIHILEM